MPKATRKITGALPALLFAVAAALLAGACDRKQGPPSGVEPPDNQVATVEVTPPTLVLSVGGNQKLTARAFNASHVALDGVTVTWSSDASGVAQVSQDGTVTAVAAGTAHITAVGAGKQATVQVTVVGQTTGNVIVVNPAVRYQTISGWEATGNAGAGSPAFPLVRQQLFDMAVNDVGINRVRLQLRSGIENTQDYNALHDAGQIDDATWRCVRYATVNDNSDPNSINPGGFHFSSLDFAVDNVILPLKQRLEARGEKLFINLNYVAFTDAICSGHGYHHNSAAEYAEFILAASLHLRSKYGLVPDAWEVILEPDNTSFWRGTQIGNAIVATAARLSASGFTPRFIAPSTARPLSAGPYFDALVQVQGVKPYLLELSFHRYGSPTDADLEAIAARAIQHGINTSMLEHIGSDYNDLHQDLKHARVSAWQQYALAFPTNDDGAQYLILSASNLASPSVIMGSRTRFLSQYFKYVRNGAVRIDATSGVTAIDPLAFINPNGGFVVVVKANAASSFGITGLPPGTYGISHTTANVLDVDHADVTIGAGARLDTSIPQRGVITIYRK